MSFRRWLETVYLPECNDFKLRQIYEAMDVLHEHTEQIEEQIFFQVANLLNLSVDIIFYDTTTASFAVDYEDEEEDGLRQYGHAKEGMWAPQVVVALAVTREEVRSLQGFWHTTYQKGCCNSVGTREKIEPTLWLATADLAPRF